MPEQLKLLPEKQLGAMQKAEELLYRRPALAPSWGTIFGAIKG